VTAPRKPRPTPPPRRLFVLFDEAGVIFGTYATAQEAEENVWGPIFYGGWTVIEYAKGKKAAGQRRKRARGAKAPRSKR